MELELEHIGYRYGDALASEMQALSDISLKITGGEFIGVIGHTGSGKSTLMQIMNALRGREGRILADGEDIWGEHYDRRSLRSRVGLVFQYPEHQLFETTVIGDVMFGPLNQGLSEKEARARAEHALALTGIDEKWYEQSPFELSGGQKRRTAIAGVLAMEPEILILDEPTAGLDPAGRGEILRQISSLHREYAGGFRYYWCRTVWKMLRSMLGEYLLWITGDWCWMIFRSGCLPMWRNWRAWGLPRLRSRICFAICGLRELRWTIRRTP